MTRKAIQQWVTAAARDPLAAGDYMRFADSERAYARRYCREYAQHPFPDFDAQLLLCQLQVSMADMERAIEQGVTS